MKKIFTFIYYAFASRLPSSYFPGGSYFNSFRYFCLKQFIQIGANSKVQNKVYLGNGENIVIGSCCQINEKVKLDNVIIGNYIMIAPGAVILGKMHESCRNDVPMVLQGEKKVEKTIIEDDVWIGTNVIIMPGLKIRKGCIIAAGAVLTKDTVEYGIYAGVPAKLIKARINREYKDKN